MAWWVIVLIVLAAIVFLVTLAVAIFLARIVLGFAEGMGQAFGMPTRRRRKT